jgi:hypothetical protein
MTDADLFKDMTTWHERYLVDAENWDRLLSAHKELAWQEMSIRIGRPDLAARSARPPSPSARRRASG